MQEQYLYWLEQQRRRSYLYNAISVKIANIARFIAAGGDPSTSPDYKDDYRYLVGEFGEGIFQSELQKLRLIREEEERHG